MSSTCHVSFLAAPDTDHKHKFSLTHFIHFSYLSDRLTNKPCDLRPIYTLRCSTAEWRINTNPISHRLGSLSRASTPLRFCPLWIGGGRWLRELEVKRWQERHQVGWDATDVRIGGTERIAWKRSSRWTDLITEVTRTRERSRWCLLWPRRSSELRLLLSTRSGFRRKGALLSRSRPSRPSSLGRSGAACFSSL